MLDYRYETFLVLSKLGSFTKTAQYLHITQPAVSQHIKYLEEYYGGKLFYYEGKSLMLTERGKLLNDFAITMSSDSQRIKELLCNKNIQNLPLRFGATLSIGEYIMPKILSKLIKKHVNLKITMLVDNTQVLLEKLRDGRINFVFLEGFFDKSKYDSEVFSVENFIPICSPKFPLANKTITFNEIFNHRLIIRENGSGTRRIFEQILLEHNSTLENFQNIAVVGNMNAIKQLVLNSLGITFLYKAVVEDELLNNEICEINIDQFAAKRDFSFVFLKNSLNKVEYLNWLKFFKEARDDEYRD